jgi:hypothetical protein
VLNLGRTHDNSLICLVAHVSWMCTFRAQYGSAYAVAFYILVWSRPP